VRLKHEYGGLSRTTLNARTENTSFYSAGRKCNATLIKIFSINPQSPDRKGQKDVTIDFLTTVASAANETNSILFLVALFSILKPKQGYTMLRREGRKKRKADESTGWVADLRIRDDIFSRMVAGGLYNASYTT